MKYINQYYLYFIVMLGIICCESPKSLQSDSAITIDIENVIDGPYSSFYLSEFASKIEYVQLETTEDGLVGSFPRFDITENYIVVRDMEKCLLFDRQTGKFIRKIGRKGRGPQEYGSTNGFVNPQKKTVYFTRWGESILEFGFDGEFKKTIKLPDYDSSDYTKPTNISFLNNNYVGAYDNHTGDLENWLVIFNEKGERIGIYKNTNIYPYTKPFVFNFPQTQFYYSNNKLFFKENYNDTIYLVTEDDLSGYLVFSAGKYSPPYETKWLPPDKIESSLGISSFMESKMDIFFNLHLMQKSFLGIYNKREDKLRLAEASEAFVNDLDNFLLLHPISITSNNEIVGYVEAWRVKEWFSENPDQAGQPKIRDIGKVSAKDNPVVIIAKLKE